MHEQSEKFNKEIATIKINKKRNPRVRKYNNCTQDLNREFQK